MKAVFADTFFYIALLDTTDADHRRAIGFVSEYRARIVTSRAVLTETANALSRPTTRGIVGPFLRHLESHATVKIVEDGSQYYKAGLELYIARPDKEWSLTDCISFCIMKDEGVTEALTADRHFAQAGFTPIFADPE